MDRKTIRAILADETLDESAKVSRLLQMHHDEVADIKSGLKTDEDVKAAVAEALKNAPKAVKVEETEEYKKLLQELDDYKYRTELTTQLKGAKVKDKFLADVIAKIKRDEKLDEQLPKLREEFGEYFDEGAPQPQPPAPKPVFSGDPQPTPPGAQPKPIPKLF
jgi:ribonuclease HII